ncbi:MAG: phage baseplate assembly protein [Pseudomonadota bacterium]
MNASQRVELLVGGRVYGGWKRVEVQRSIEQMAGGFILELTHRWPGVDVAPGLREGLPCQVLLGGDVVITGYIDQFEPDLSDANCSIRVEGRDKTGDLVDCSAVHKGGQWANVPLERIVRDIARPFGISVALQPGLNQGAPFKSFALEDGERAFDAIDRACRLRSVLCTSTPLGEIWLGEAGDTGTGVTLQEGVNLKRISATHSWKDRYSRIIVKSQTSGDDESWGAAASQLRSEATDEEIDRYRPLIIQAEHGDNRASLSDRAQWEIGVRMGRGKRGKAVVVGWRTGANGTEGGLWQPNTLARVISPRMNLNMDVLIVSCVYTLTEQGALTELTFSRPEAFDQVTGIGRSRLRGRLRDKAERRKYGEDEFVPSWQRQPPGGKP